MIKKLSLFCLVLLLSFAFAVQSAPTAKAAFDPHNIMNDAVFSYSGSMSATDIQNFLNRFPTSCLRNLSVPYPNNYFSYGGNVSAATVIKRASDLWNINPQVILATLQKESSVVTGDASYGCAYLNTSMGFNCPDAGACPEDPANAGFSQQVTKGAWLLKAGQERSLGHINWDPPLDPDDDRNYYYAGPMTQGTFQRKYNAPAQYFDSLYTIDGQAVHMSTGATASFYFYTPHLHGNQNFVAIFESWFGSTQTLIPYVWSYESQDIYSDAGRTNRFSSVPTVAPGGKLYMRVKARNNGNQAWSQSVVHLATTGPRDRSSAFYDNTWLNPARPGQLIETSVQPGQLGTFEFTMTAPAAAGSYTEFFSLVADGVAWFNDPGLRYSINVVSPVSASNSTNTGLASGAMIRPKEYLLSPDTQSVLALQKDGNLVLYGNFNALWSSATAGQTADRLVMQGDGNLVLYSTTNQALWNSQTNGYPNAHLELQTDGNLVLYSQGGTPIWATSTMHNPNHLSYVNTSLNPSRLLYAGQSIQTADRRFKLVLQNDGNLVLYSPNRATWNSATVGRQSAYLAMQSDGNLVLYDKNNNPVWHTATMWGGLSYLAMQSDGNLVIYNGVGAATWNSFTAHKL